MLLLGEDGHDDQRVQINALAQHPEVVAAHDVHVNEGENLAAALFRKRSRKRISVARSTNRTHVREIRPTWSLGESPCVTQNKVTVTTEFKTNERKRFL